MKPTLKPHITEKSYRNIPEAKDAVAVYTFKVNDSLDKELISTLIEKEYKVTVVSVNIVNLPGKSRRFRGVRGRTSSVKKAIVRLKKGDRISAFDLPETESEDKK